MRYSLGIPLTELGSFLIQLLRPKAALYCLQLHKWNLEVAVDEYFANPPDIVEDDGPSVDGDKLTKEWNKYAGMLSFPYLFVFFKNAWAEI